MGNRCFGSPEPIRFLVGPKGVMINYEILKLDPLEIVTSLPPVMLALNVHVLRKVV